MLPMPSRSRFLSAIDDVIRDSSRRDLYVAVLVIDMATPNQYEELARALGQDGVDLCQDASATWIGKYLPEHAELYSLSAARFGCVLQVDAPDDAEETLDRFAYRIRTPEPAGRCISLAISVGLVSPTTPHHGADAAELLRLPPAPSMNRWRAEDPGVCTARRSIAFHAVRPSFCAISVRP